MRPSAIAMRSLNQRVEPIEVLHPRFDRVGRGQVAVNLHREVRRQRQPGLRREGGELQELGDAADPRASG